MTDTLTTILQWLIPSGGLGAVIAWLFSRTLRNLRQTKEVHDTYKTLYEDISNTLTDVQNELDELHKELGRFRRAVSKIYSCRYYPDCPVQHELQNSEAVANNGNKVRKSNRQYRIRNTAAENNPGTGSESEHDSSDAEPP
jgi:hypothetical protein